MTAPFMPTKYTLVKYHELCYRPKEGPDQGKGILGVKHTYGKQRGQRKGSGIRN